MEVFFPFSLIERLRMGECGMRLLRSGADTGENVSCVCMGQTHTSNHCIREDWLWISQETPINQAAYANVLDDPMSSRSPQILRDQQAKRREGNRPVSPRNNHAAILLF